MTAVAIPGYVTGTWTLDPAHTEIGFSVRHMMVSKVRGKFDKFTGTITTATDPLESHAEAEIDLASVNTGQDQRDAHLRSNDFFNTDKHTKMTFRSTGIRPDGRDFLVDGDLTIRGVHADPYGGTRLGLTATGVINRHDFGVSWNAAIEGGGVVVADKVTITIEAEATLDRPAA